eukprot:GHVH01004760.1.p1 GENE.GHVH01004760.1~~GHVH01004760.1.p1  ORF type:complete len:869 (+),score=118.92 GHVH01004760.1:192-2798(+)
MMSSAAVPDSTIVNVSTTGLQSINAVKGEVRSARANSSLGMPNDVLKAELDISGCSDIDAEAVNPPWYAFEPILTPANEVKLVNNIPGVANIQDHDVDLLHRSHHGDSFSVLGAHIVDGSHEPMIVVRVWVKDAVEMEIKIRDQTNYKMSGDLEWIPLHKRADWLYQLCMTVDNQDYDISEFMYDVRCKYGSDDEWHYRGDAYNFGLVISDFDLTNFQSGHCWHVDNIMGNHRVVYNGVEGVRFSLWAPNAQFISVVGDWNQWDGRSHPMRRRHEYGCWELFIPTVVQPCEKYGYKIHTRAGTDVTKIDPFAHKFCNPPAYDSMISDCDDAFKSPSERFQWQDAKWLQKRANRAAVPEHAPEHVSRQAMSIYEVHLASWMRGDNNNYLSYREIADPLVSHLKSMNFTHVEFMPLAHHPFEGSWGYQVSGNYAPYSRIGTGDDLKYLINKLHENDIGVFVDIVPAHFCKDDWGLARFDGEPLFEYADPREGELKGWGTYCFNFKRSEVRSYLLGAAYHWIRRYHIDGLRVDAVSAMIYRNYCRAEGEWIPNEFGGDANLEAISLLQEMNWVVHKNFPGVFMMAEESTSWKGVTNKESGLGFDAKWDLGWMNDTLAYSCSPDKSGSHSKLTFRGLYVNHESWVLPLSHDEVVSGKGSLLDKMGYKDVNFMDKLRTLKTVIAFQITLPGRPLLMMGSEFGQGREWSEKRSLDWHEAEEENRSKVMLFLSDMLALYRDKPSLHCGDDEAWNFKWHVADDHQNNVIAYTRSYGEWSEDCLFVCNFSGQKKYRYPIGVSHGCKWRVLINSDDWKYGGGMHGRGNGDSELTTQGGVLGWPYCLWMDIAANSCILLQPIPEELPEPKNKEVDLTRK